MNSFNQQILTAKKKQRLLYIKVFTFFIIGALVVFTTIIASQGSRIEIHPGDASELSSIQLDKGIGIIMGETLYSISKKPAITVSAEGFKSVLYVLRKHDFGKVIAVTLEPLPAKIELSTNINDDKTRWLINSSEIKIAAVFKYQLPAGDYKLTVIHPYYHDVPLALSLARNELFKKVILLTPINGKLFINTNPQGAHILINGADKGVSPLEIPLQGGIHELKVKLNNYQTITDTIEINRIQSDINQDYKLEPKKAAITVSLTPQGGKLVLDNNIVSNPHKIPVSKGVKHSLSYSKPGFFTQKRTITLNTDDIVNVVFELKKEIGRVEIKSSPEAGVELNGKLMGSTPLLLSLNAVEQKITLRKQCFHSITKRIIPTASATRKINVTLVNEKSTRLKDAPKFYSHKAGGTLKLFTPKDTFIMGAKRSEPGQRANEFVKEVRLSKAFYAGITEVTNDEYRRYNKNKTGPSREPVTSVSWIEAAEFCNWLSQLEDLSPVYHINNKQLIRIIANTDGYRLLTEAEWEWLARKSGKSMQTLFVWGNDYVIPKDAVNIADESANGSVKTFVPKYNDGYLGVAPVKSFSQEKSGLYDQGGNVSEWTHDNYSIVLPKSGKVFNDPFDLTTSHSHVVKGANWRSGSVTELRQSFKEGLVDSRDDLGFRIGRYVYGGN